MDYEDYAEVILGERDERAFGRYPRTMHTLSRANYYSKLTKEGEGISREAVCIIIASINEEKVVDNE